MAFIPGVERNSITVADALIADKVRTDGAIIAMRAATVDADFVKGRLCHIDSLGKLHFLATAETAVIIEAAAGDIILNSADGSQTVFDLKLATPPIPGTVTIVSTVDGNATPVLSIGPDNGEGRAESADGSFDIDYDSGLVRIVYAVAPTATHDLKAAYTHRIVDAVPTNEAGRGLPRFVLVESVLGAAVVAADVVTTVFTGGRLNSAELVGYSAGYEPWLRTQGFTIQ